ncbi:hypothetical protein ACFOGJ_08655 [Marinibaculum pumilum]|uniref:Uncharacterized protein n=1 Tax=Marinibaculum pumilum TaxID=1766165 RepID=A0ABV7KY19_9PROT
MNGAQTSQVAADGVAPDQASGVTAPGDLDAEGDGSGGQGDFENPASGENIFQAQLAGSEEELAGTERPLSPIEEAILDFPPDAVVQPEDTFSAAATDAVSRQTGAATTTASAESGDTAGSEEVSGQFGVSETQAAEQAQATQREEAARQAADEEANRETSEPRTNLSGATDDPFNIANGSAASQSGSGSPAAQPPGSTVDIAA